MPCIIPTKPTTTTARLSKVSNERAPLLPPHSFGSNKQNILPRSSLSSRVGDAAVFFHFFTLLCSGRRVSERDRAAVWHVNAQSTTRTPVYGTAMTQINYGVMKRDAQSKGGGGRHASVGDQEKANSEDGARGRRALVGDIGAKTRLKLLPDRVKLIQ